MLLTLQQRLGKNAFNASAKAFKRFYKTRQLQRTKWTTFAIKRFGEYLKLDKEG